MAVHIRGEMAFDGKRYAFGSGGIGDHGPIPYGDYPITPRAIGAWGEAHGALGINNDKIWDQGAGRYREGIELHPGSGELYTEGCLGFQSSIWPALRQAILDQIKAGHRLYLHAHPTGFSIDDKPHA